MEGIIRFYWEFKDDETCDRCSKMAKTIYVNTNMIPHEIYIEMSKHHRVLIFGFNLCLECITQLL